jgi:putative nucleotidyltransferase with HDIG domain
MTTTARGPRSEGGVGALIILVTSAAAAALAVTAEGAWNAISARPGGFLSFFALSVLLALLAVELYGGGRISVAGIGLLALGFTFGEGAAMATAIVIAATHAVITRGDLDRTLFNAGALALAAGAATAVFQALVAAGWTMLDRLGPAAVAGVLFWAVNIGLLTLAMSRSEQTRFVPLWTERFRWLTPHYAAFGPLALASTIAYEEVGLSGLLAFLLPPALLIISVRQYLHRTRAAVEEVRRQNEDLTALFEFAGGLAAQAHDPAGLVAYAEDALSRLTSTDARVLLGSADGEIELLAGGSRIGSLQLPAVNGFDGERWERLREAILPQLATALESGTLVEQVRKTHLDTIAALSRSMEAKDYYTGGHTERVAEISVALARRLGFDGADVDAIEIGALLHDIGKIGIPERILHKPGPLDDEEWRVMKEHPVISEYILSGIDMSPIVRQIARSTHERIDGAGYPDAVVGDEIPLPARIVFVADAFDALTSDRPYRRGRGMLAALEEIKANSGTQFCELVVAALDQIAREEPDLLTAGTIGAAKVA